MKKFFLILFIFLNIALSADNDVNESFVYNENLQHKINTYKNDINAINHQLKGSIWLTRFSNFATYEKLSTQVKEVDDQIKKISNLKNEKKQIESLNKKKDSLQKQLQLLQNFEDSPFNELVTPPQIEESPTITNPLAIITGFSHIRKLQSDQKLFKDRVLDLDNLMQRLKNKKELLQNLISLEDNNKTKMELDTINKELQEFSDTHDILKTTYIVYNKKVEESILTTTNKIRTQFKKTFDIGIFIVVVIILSFLFKFFARKYIKDNVRFYMANKIINFVNVGLIILLVLFAYIENVTYFITVIGFASAGLAIAMKDMFMSVLGWLVIVFGGSFHVGDRIKVQKDGATYVGDIIDISLLRMTLFEDITYTSYTLNRRTGRVIFVPNNYIFTDLIANYTHVTLKTVWDGIDLTLTFDSNHKKAMYIIKNLTAKYSKGYTDIARKQLNMLRHQYNLKNTNVEPRIYSFLEPHGVTISTWYMTNSYAALTLRSTLSFEIIQAINKEDDITIAYPTQTLHVKKQNHMQDININKDVLF